MSEREEERQNEIEFQLNCECGQNYNQDDSTAITMNRYVNLMDVIQIWIIQGEALHGSERARNNALQMT